MAAYRSLLARAEVLFATRIPPEVVEPAAAAAKLQAEIVAIYRRMNEPVRRGSGGGRRIRGAVLLGDARLATVSRSLRGWRPSNP